MAMEQGGSERGIRRIKADRTMEKDKEKGAGFIGLDIGTQGARAVWINTRGEQVAAQEQAFPLSEHSRMEQSPAMWWATCETILKALVAEGRRKADLATVQALAVTSTSGTVIPLDHADEPLHPALMYSDRRAHTAAPDCEQAALAYFGDRFAYTHFNASSGLSKMVWFVRQFPDQAARIKTWAHAADYVTGKLSGVFGVSDDTNALKSGYDIFAGSWPAYLYDVLPLEKQWLPRIVPPGSPVGFLTPELQSRLGFEQPVQVVAGLTDGCASQIASGAVKVGDWNTTIGTTMVIKGVTRRPISDPEGRLYNHRHPDYQWVAGKPEGYFMPGGAGNTGADWVTMAFKNDFEQLAAGAEALLPSGHLAWPLCTEGERFPLFAPEARGFAPEGLSRQQLFIANMEGVAYLEKYAYQLITELSQERVAAIYTAGGGSKSDLWLKIRCNVLNVPLYKMRYVSGAVGAAILAASKTYYSSLPEAARNLTQAEKVIQPEKPLVAAYQPLYQQFLSTLQNKGYMNRE